MYDLTTNKIRTLMLRTHWSAFLKIFQFMHRETIDMVSFLKIKKMSMSLNQLFIEYFDVGRRKLKTASKKWAIGMA